MADDPRPQSVTFCEYPKFVYAWPLIVLGFVLWPFAATREVPDVQAPTQSVQAVEGDEAGQVATGKPLVRVTGQHELLGWVYLVVLFLVILTLGVDVERNYAFFWTVALIAVWLALWLLAEKNIPVFRQVYRFFADLGVSYDRALGLALSIFLAVPYVVMVLWSQLTGRWRITHNEFEHRSWGRTDDSLARGAKRVRTLYPDLFEFLLLGAGTLIVYSASGQTELRRLQNIPLLFIKRKKIDRILGAVAVTPAAAEEDAGNGSAEERETL